MKDTLNKDLNKSSQHNNDLKSIYTSSCDMNLLLCHH